MTAVSCQVTDWILDWFAIGELSEEDWIHDLPVTIEHLRDRSLRIDWDLFVALLGRIEKMFDSREALLLSARSFIDKRFSEEKQTQRSGLNNQRQLYWIAQRWLAPSLFPDCIGPFGDSEPNQVRLEIALPKTARPCPLLFPLIETALQLAPRLLGEPPAEMTSRIERNQATFLIELASTNDYASNRETAQRLTVLTDSRDTLLLESNPEGEILYASASALSVVGYSADELVGRIGLDFLAAEWQQNIDQVGEPTGNGYPYRGRIPYRHRDGGDRWLDATIGSYVRQDGSVRFVTIAQDITGQVQSERALSESELRFQTLSELGTDYSFAVRIHADGSMTRLWITEAFTQVTGYQPDDKTVDGWDEIIHPDDLPQRAAAHQQAIRTGSASIEYRIRTKSDEWCWIRERSRITPELDGDFHWFGSCRDITAQRNAEQAQRLSDRRYRSIAENSRDVILEFDQAGDIR